MTRVAGSHYIVRHLDGAVEEVDADAMLETADHYVLLCDGPSAFESSPAEVVYRREELAGRPERVDERVAWQLLSRGHRLN